MVLQPLPTDPFNNTSILDTLKRLKEYKEVKVPIYNFVTHRREERMVPMYGANVIIFEGIFAFHDKQVVDLLDMKVKINDLHWVQKRFGRFAVYELK